MKILITIIIGLFISFSVLSQSCLPEGIFFESQGAIDSFQVNYPGCTEIDGSVSISGSNITNLVGLNVLNLIDESLHISYCDSLTSLSGLDNLTSIGSELHIYHNSALNNLSGLGNLTSIGLNVWIYDNYILGDLSGLENLISIGRQLFIFRNDSLTNITGIEVESLKSIGEELWIENNPVLSSLAALEGLGAIGGNLFIGYDNSLKSLAGLENINASSILNLYIVNNDSLSTCEVRSVCEFLANPNGTINIQNNAIGCNNPEEVLEACLAGFDENNFSENQISIYPNPTSSTITIDFPNNKGINNTFLTLCNISGELILTRYLTERLAVMDLCGLADGIYYLKVTSDSAVNIYKIVKN